jgi:hypothetical protein
MRANKGGKGSKGLDGVQGIGYCMVIFGQCTRVYCVYHMLYIGASLGGKCTLGSGDGFPFNGS